MKHDIGHLVRVKKKISITCSSNKSAKNWRCWDPYKTILYVNNKDRAPHEWAFPTFKLRMRIVGIFFLCYFSLIFLLPWSSLLAIRCHSRAANQPVRQSLLGLFELYYHEGKEWAHIDRNLMLLHIMLFFLYKRPLFFPGKWCTLTLWQTMNSQLGGSARFSSSSTPPLSHLYHASSWPKRFSSLSVFLFSFTLRKTQQPGANIVHFCATITHPHQFDDPEIMIFFSSVSTSPLLHLPILQMYLLCLRPIAANPTETSTII